MKVTKKQLSEMIQNALKNHINEAQEDSDSLDKDTNSFLDKTKSKLEDYCKGLLELAEEGEKLVLEDLSKKDRNAKINLAVGVLKKVHGICVQAAEHLRRNVG